MGVMWWFDRRLRIPPRRYSCTNSTQNKIRPLPRSTKLRRSLKQQKNRKRKKSLRRQRRNERESFNQSRCERSEDRHHRGWSRFAGCARCRSRDARSEAFRFGEHENKSRSRYVGCKTVAAKRNGTRAGRLRRIADLARRRRRLRTKAA